MIIFHRITLYKNKFHMEVAQTKNPPHGQQPKLFISVSRYSPQRQPHMMGFLCLCGTCFHRVRQKADLDYFFIKLSRLLYQINAN